MIKYMHLFDLSILINIDLCILNVHIVIKIKWTENKCNVSTCFILLQLQDSVC